MPWWRGCLLGRILEPPGKWGRLRSTCFPRQLGCVVPAAAILQDALKVSGVEGGGLPFPQGQPLGKLRLVDGVSGEVGGVDGSEGVCQKGLLVRWEAAVGQNV